MELPPRLRSILEQPYPRFSEPEMGRRRDALRELAERRGVDLILVCGENRAGSGVAWLTGWPVTAEAVALFEPRRPGKLLVQ